MDVGLNTKILFSVTTVAVVTFLIWSVGHGGYWSFRTDGQSTGDVNGLWSAGNDGQYINSQPGKCPCVEEKFCQRIQDTTRKEIFVFSLKTSNQDWKFYNWDKVTTVVMVGYVDLELMCLAHRYGARVVTIGSAPTAILPEKEARSKWIAGQLSIVRQNYLDGINIDYEDPILLNQTHLSQAYTSLVRETKLAFQKEFPTSQVTVDVAWSPDCIDLRCYDYVGLSKVSEFLLVMAYAEQSQILGKCIAKANSPFNNTTSGIQRFLDIGVPRDKLVLGVSWDGIDYLCIQLTKTDECSIKEVPFRGVNCSDAAGKEKRYSVVIELLKTSSSGRKYDKIAESPYFDYKDAKTGTMHQMWYDDPKSLSIKYKMAVDKNLRGVGMWQAESVNYTSSDPDQIKAVIDMWDALPDY